MPWLPPRASPQSSALPPTPLKKSTSTSTIFGNTKMAFTPILATLAYVLSPDARQVLLIHRHRRPDDPHYGKYNGLGGKLDPGEDVVAGIRREIREEAGPGTWGALLLWAR